MLRASEVTADLRLTSLLRGRLEISRLDLSEPSLNLVHAEGGRWNLEALLERTAHIPLAPTGKAKSEPRPGFPYIEATSARINFKSGPEKKPYALTNANFSLWQDSENSWGVRLEGATVSHRFEFERHGPAAGERHVAESRRAARYACCSSAWSGTARNSDSSQNSSRETTRAGAEKCNAGCDAVGNSGEAAGHEQRLDPGFPALRHYERTGVASGGPLRGRIQFAQSAQFTAFYAALQWDAGRSR